MTTTRETNVQNSAYGAACMMVSVICFTINTLLLKHLSSHSQVSPWVCLVFRAIVGIAIIWSVFGLSGAVNFRRAATSRMLVARGFFGILGTTAYYFTIGPLGPGKATLISNTYVVISAILAVWILKERLTAAKLFGNIVAFVGVILLIGLSVTDLSVVTGYELLALFGAFMAAATVIVIRQLTRTESSATIYASQCVFVLLASIAPAYLYWTTLSPAAIGLLLAAAVSASLGQLAMTDGFRHLTVAIGGAFQILVPVCIAVGGVVFFSESFTTLQIVGASMILAGCYVAVIGR